VTRDRNSAKRILTLRAAQREKYGSLYDELLRILAKHDPTDMAELSDEYDPEVGTILLRLERDRSAFDARRIIHEEFVDWFSAGLGGPEENFDGMSTEVWAARERYRTPPRARR
jgi:hypothetical protein